MREKIAIYPLTVFCYLSLSFLALGENSFRELATESKQVEYFAEFYSFEGHPLRPSEAHSFARFVKTLNGKPIEKVDLSWLPKEDFIRPGGRMPLFDQVPGKLYSVEETILVAGTKPVKHHGKFSIDEAFFQQALDQRRFLTSEKVGYRMLPGEGSTGGLSSLQVILGSSGDLLRGRHFGSQATEAVISFLKKTGKLFQQETPSDSKAPPQSRLFRPHAPPSPTH